MVGLTPRPGNGIMLGVMKRLLLPIVIVCTALPSVAMKNRRETFPESCEVVWKAAIAVAKTQDYRIVSVAAEEQIISLSVGGAWWGERIISLSLASDGGGCTATVQSRYAGVQHSDAPELLGRIHVQLVGGEVDQNSKAFRKFKNCHADYGSNEAKCEEKLRRTLAESSQTQAKSQ